MEQFNEPFPSYAILSHTWGSDDEEISFRDVNDEKRLSFKAGAGRTKLDGCCTQAKKDGYKYIWIDTCCIDQHSERELGEAINSMFRWYRDASTCYVYLSDVSVSDALICDDSIKAPPSLRKSRWFTRGWTLQELIAPKSLHFYDANWKSIGTKQQLIDELVKITGIPRLYLRNRLLLSMASVAQRMSWAAQRVTKRSEDMAYCLLGLFNISIPLIYGEGGDKAFIRLQEEIMRKTPDDSILAWDYGKSPTEMQCGALATSPRNFLLSRPIVCNDPDSAYASPIEVSGGNLSLQRRLHTDEEGQSFLILNCHPEGTAGQVTAVRVRLDTTQSPHNLYKRLQASALTSLPTDSIKEATRLIYLLMVDEEPKPEFNWLCGLYVPNTQLRDLKLFEVEPQRCWHRDLEEIHFLKEERVWTRFRHTKAACLDILVAMDFRWSDAQPELHYQAMVCSNDTALHNIITHFDTLGISTWGRHNAHNGVKNVHVHITREHVPSGCSSMFTLKLDVSTDKYQTINVSHELKRLDLCRQLASNFIRSYKLCLQATGIDFETRDDNGYSPLFHAASKGHEEVIRLLLDKGANFVPTDNKGQAPSTHAIPSSYEATSQLISEEEAECSEMMDFLGLEMPPSPISLGQEMFPTGTSILTPEYRSRSTRSSTARELRTSLGSSPAEANGQDCIRQDQENDQASILSIDAMVLRKRTNRMTSRVTKPSSANPGPTSRKRKAPSPKQTIQSRQGLQEKSTHPTANELTQPCSGKPCPKYGNGKVPSPERMIQLRKGILIRPKKSNGLPTEVWTFCPNENCAKKILDVDPYFSWKKSEGKNEYIKRRRPCSTDECRKRIKGNGGQFMEPVPEAHLKSTLPRKAENEWMEKRMAEGYDDSDIECDRDDEDNDWDGDGDEN